MTARRSPATNAPKSAGTVPRAVAKSARETGTATGPGLPLPHDRDESTAQKGRAPEPVMEQASADLRRGLTDTDLHGRAGAVFDRKWGGAEAPRKTRK